jgi:hypothetical protein
MYSVVILSASKNRFENGWPSYCQVVQPRVVLSLLNGKEAASLVTHHQRR